MQKFINSEKPLPTVAGNDYRKNFHREFIQALHGYNFKISSIDGCMSPMGSAALTILL